MRKHLIIFLLLAASACQSVKQPNLTEAKKEEVLFTVDGDPVSKQEFVYVYKKNNATNDSAFTKSDVEEYLDLYKKFKLKIAEAESQGLDTTKSFKKEFNTYQEQLKKPYLTETKVTEKLLQEAYDRYKTEINASHLLLKVDPNASPEDTLKTYNRLLEIRDEAENTAFEELAKKYSQDPSAARNGGNLGYFTSFQMVYPFESAAYKTPEGEVSDPVRTRFGYHLIKVHDKRPSQGKVMVSHLMIRSFANQDSTVARNKIFELYEQATGGANWEQLVEQFSQDVNSKKKGGVLPAFKVGQMPFPFQEAAFSIQEPGEFSDPVRTPYGWHIIRLEKREPLESFDEMKTSIQARIKRDSRADINKKVLINRLKKENGFSLNEENKKEIFSLVDSSLIKGKWSYPETTGLLEKNLFTVGDTTYNVKSFADYVVANQRATGGSPSLYMQRLYDDFEHDAILKYEELHLEDKYYDYKMLVKEYKEGIMLFQLMEDEVWQKAVDDSVGLRNYYESNNAKYKWKERLHATIYNSDSDKIISDIERLIAADDSLAWSKKELENKYNQQTALTLEVESGKYEIGENSIVDKVEKSTGIHKLDLGDRKALVYVHSIIPPEVKPFDQIKGIVISDYQNFLEKEWLEQLKEKYPVVVNEEVLKDVYKTLIKK